MAVDHGAVSFSGEVESYPQLLLATKAAQRVHGATALAQDLTVHSSWSSPNDADIAREAGEAIARSVDGPDQMKVKVRNQFITLSGSVTWEHVHNYQEVKNVLVNHDPKPLGLFS